MTDAGPEFTIERAGTDEASFREVFQLLLELHKAGGLFPLDVKRAAQSSWAALQENMTFLARDGDGTAIGVLMLTRETPYYSSVPFLASRDFYVRPEWRKGKVGVALLKAAGEEAQRLGLLCFVQIDNPDRRPKRTTMTLMAQEAGFVPLGYTLSLSTSRSHDFTTSPAPEVR